MFGISECGRIFIDGRMTQLALVQDRYKTRVFTPERRCNPHYADERPYRPYREHKMPHNRYATSWDDTTKAGNPGRTQLEADIRCLLDQESEWFAS